MAQGPRTGSLTSFPPAPSPSGRWAACQSHPAALAPLGAWVSASYSPFRLPAESSLALLKGGKRLFILVPGQGSLPRGDSLPTRLPLPRLPPPSSPPAPLAALWVPNCVTPASYVTMAIVHGSPQLQTPRGQGPVPVVSAPPAGGQGLAPTWPTSTSADGTPRRSCAVRRGAGAEGDGPTPASAQSDPFRQPLSAGDCPHPSSRGQQELASTLPTPSTHEGPQKSVRFPPKSPWAWEQASLPLALLLVHPRSPRQPAADFVDPNWLVSPHILNPFLSSQHLRSLLLLLSSPFLGGPTLSPLLPLVPGPERQSLLPGQHCFLWLHVTSSGKIPPLPRTR